MPPRTAPTTADQPLEIPQDLPLVLRAGARLAAVELGEKPKTTGGRWRLNAGSEMVTRVWGVNMAEGYYGMTPKPIRLVLDFSGLQAEADKVRCVSGHWYGARDITGWWTEIDISQAGVVASLTWFEPKSEEVRAAAHEALLLRELVDAGDPMEASLGIAAFALQDYELIPADQAVTVNGKTFEGAGELPLYVMRRGSIFEASLVLFGADRDTGRVAASRLHSHPKDIAMSITAARLTALLAKHAGHESVILAQLAAKEDVTDAEIAQAVLAADNAALQARLAQAEADLAKARETAPAQLTGKPPATPPSFDGGGDGDQAPADLKAALRALKDQGVKLTGAQAIREVYRRWPALAR